MLRYAEQDFKRCEFRCASYNRPYVTGKISGLFPTVSECLRGVSGLPLLIGLGKQPLPILGSGRGHVYFLHDRIRERSATRQSLSASWMPPVAMAAMSHSDPGHCGYPDEWCIGREPSRAWWLSRKVSEVLLADDSGISSSIPSSIPISISISISTWI